MYLRCDYNHCFLWNHYLLYSGLNKWKWMWKTEMLWKWEKKIFCINVVFGCISPGFRIFKGILGVWLGLNSKNRTESELGVGWIFFAKCILLITQVSFFFVFLTSQPVAYLSMIIHEEIVVRAKHPSPLCVYRCWTCLVGFSLFLPQAYLTMSWEIYFQSQMLTYFAHLVLQAWAEYLFQSLCNLFFHILPETHIFIPWNTNFFTVLKADVLCTWLRNFITHTSNSGCEELKI